MSIVLNPAPTAWASDTNYSSGPNSGTPTKVDPGSGRFAAGWVPGDTLPAQHLNFHLAAVTTALADIVSKVSNKALDGAGGGSYTPTAPINFLGAQSVNFHTASVDSTGTFTVTPGGKIDVISGGAIEFNAPGDLKIDSVIGSYRLTLTPQAVALASNVMTWQPVSPPCAGWVQTNVSAQHQISFPLPLNPGDDILSVSVVIDGGVGVGHGGSVPTGADRLTISLVQVSTSGTVTTLATLADASSAVVYDTSHTLTLQNGAVGMTGTMPQLVDEDFAYYVLVAGEAGGDAVANTTVIRAVAGTCVARSYRASLVTL
jgi:hypothetical protein